MKIKNANVGPLTNFEVLDFLRSRGAAKDPARVIVPVAPSEYKVFDYLDQSAACSQTRDSIKEFVENCQKFNLAKAEILNILNIRPSSVVEIDPIIEKCETRMESVEELIELVAKVLPPPPSPPPSEMESDGAINENKDAEEIPDGEEMESDDDSAENHGSEEISDSDGEQMETS